MADMLVLGCVNLMSDCLLGLACCSRDLGQSYEKYWRTGGVAINTRRDGQNAWVRNPRVFARAEHFY